MPNIAATSNLLAPLPNGTAGQAQVFRLGQFDALHHSITPALPLTIANDHPEVAVAVVTGLEVDVRAVGPGTTTIVITDGRAGIPAVTLTVNVTGQTDLSSLEIVGTDAVRSV